MYISSSRRSSRPTKKMSEVKKIYISCILAILYPTKSFDVSLSCANRYEIKRSYLMSLPLGERDSSPLYISVP